MEDETDVHRSMTVENGTIVAFDEPSDADTRGRRTWVADLQGAHVFPALIDAHLHLLDTVALSSIGERLCDIEGGRVEPHDLAGVGQRVSDFARTKAAGSVIVFSNYISVGIEEGRLPNRLELDEWTGDARTWVLNIDGHSSSCSTALLEELGLEEAAPDGILTGAVHDANTGRITDYLGSCVTPALLGSGIADFCNECADYGIGCVCAMDGTDDSERDRMTEMIAFLAQRFPLDVRLFPQYMDQAKIDRVLPRMRTKRVGGCMKWELDGSVGSSTAAFRRPFVNGRQGSLYFEDGFLEEKVRNLAAHGYLVSAHAIGERAIEQLVDCYEQSEGRHRIDHCEFPAPDTLPRLYRMKPYVTVQPGYAWIDKRYLHGYERVLDAQMIAQQVPLADLAAHGVVLLGSSDSPVQTVDPYLQMRGMREFYLPEQSLSAFEALKAYTVNGGMMLGEKKGLLRRGYEASFFTMDRDLLSLPPEGLANLHANALYLRGKRYEKMPRGAQALAQMLGRIPRKI